MALGDFTHIVVGSAEVSYLVFAGELPWRILADIRRADPGRQYHWRQLYLCADQSCADPQRKQLAG